MVGSYREALEHLQCSETGRGVRVVRDMWICTHDHTSKVLRSAVLSSTASGSWEVCAVSLSL